MDAFHRALGLLATLAIPVACAGSPARPATPRPAAGRAPAVPAVPVPADGYPAVTDRAAAAHLLDRFAFGPRPGDRARVQQMGARAWVEGQLAPSSGPDPAAQAALAPYRDALSPPLELLDIFAKRDLDDDASMKARFKNVSVRKLLGTEMMAEISRHVASDRQLEEVMVDVWTNHFNVFALKGPVRVLAADYVERAIRPHALGRFEDLLVASAHHPAMLVYLDNVRSTSKRGLNENYARELLELHTLGADGGYTQADVIAVARILTGWSIVRPAQGAPAFVFRPRLHDVGEKVVMGRTFPAGHGADEGDALLHMLAASPATARHVARALCERFVADDAPPACVDRVAASYVRTGGDVRAMIRTIAASSGFWQHRDNKLKSPLELLVSAVRAVGGAPDGSLGLARASAALGEPLLLDPVPTGYPDRADAWSGASALLARMSFATALASGRLPGVRTDLSRAVPASSNPDALVKSVDDSLLGGRGSDRTLAAIREQVGGVRDAGRARQLAVALALGSPEFQCQ